MYGIDTHDVSLSCHTIATLSNHGVSIRTGISDLAQTDLRGYVSAGNNVVFIGSYNWLSVMNEIFSFQLMSDYKV
jgi:hypothetical protein